ncbi:hypothetical protein C5E45_17785 [Nocardia nova]|uniref:DUF3558 domain-containing protein n=1 Tax=Nocardia nova TaxID=37330 RepID=A0A2S6AP58_9NOCA|nr:DUF3558 domain-containing protein [Nocardia nova]PPJ28821.1 hypothetical protein C5E41_12180 [Nocardia nova]PPJ37061.1 hypothetical protein C5E45_17785 [Nocardia nova]
MKVSGLAIVLAASAVVLSSCAAGGGDSDPANTEQPSTSSGPSVAVSVKPAPEQDPDGRQPVKFDPCLKVGDSTIKSAGFDPQTRERADQVHTGYAFIGCSFERREDVYGSPHRVGSLTISSTDITLDQFRQRENGKATEVNVNGRPAITYKGMGPETCFVTMTGPDATISLQLDSMSALTGWRSCDHAQEIASTIEAALPK